MTEDGDEVEPLGFHEYIERAEDRRDERSVRAAYKRVESVLEAVELYREMNEIETVSEEMNCPEERVRGAIMVHRLVVE